MQRIAIEAELFLSKFEDAHKKPGTISMLNCPGCGGAVVSLNAMSPCHLAQAELLELAEVLRAGPDSPFLRPLRDGAGSRYFTHVRQGGSVMLLYAADGDCALVVTGLGQLETKLNAAWMTAQMRDAFSTAMFTAVVGSKNGARA